MISGLDKGYTDFSSIESPTKFTLDNFNPSEGTSVVQKYNYPGGSGTATEQIMSGGTKGLTEVFSSTKSGVVAFPISSLKTSTTRSVVQATNVVSEQKSKVSSLSVSKQSTSSSFIPKVQSITSQSTSQTESLNYPRVSVLSEGSLSQVPRTSLSYATAAAQVSQTVPKYAFSSQTISKVPSVPLTVVPPPFVPGFGGFPSDGDYRKKSNPFSLKGKKRTRYVPSYSALLFKIPGKYKAGKLKGSGLDFRPVTKGYSLMGGGYKTSSFEVSL
jgi:hypothetical protein